MRSAPSSRALRLGFTALLATYVQLSGSLGAVYGSLAAVVALLLWVQLTSIAIFFGLAPSAQLEAIRARVRPGRASMKSVPLTPKENSRSASPETPGATAMSGRQSDRSPAHFSVRGDRTSHDVFVPTWSIRSPTRRGSRVARS